MHAPRRGCPHDGEFRCEEAQCPLDVRDGSASQPWVSSAASSLGGKRNRFRRLRIPGGHRWVQEIAGPLHRGWALDSSWLSDGLVAPVQRPAVRRRLAHSMLYRNGIGRRHGLRWPRPAIQDAFRKARNPMGEIMDKVKGKAKQVAGTLTGNDKLKTEGEVDELKG